MAKTLALDISSNNHNGMPFNWLAAYEAGYRAVYIKATQNDNYLNPYLIADCRDARNAGFEVGVYHFYGSSVGVMASPQEQAQWFKHNGIDQVSEFTTLVPVVDVEVGTPGELLQAGIEFFISDLGIACGVYMDGNYQETMPNLDGNFLWLAWPGWTNEAVPSHCAMVQFSQLVVPGIGEDANGKTNLTDINEVLTLEVIGMVENKILNAPIVAALSCPSGGYWLFGADGGVFCFGSATMYGDAASVKLNRPVIAAMLAEDGKGYCLVGADGGTFPYGSFKNEGNIPGLGIGPAPTTI